MTKTPVSEIKIGQLIKVTTKVETDGDRTFTVLLAAHTKKAAPARIVDIIREGRWAFIITDMGQIMIGASGKVTLV